MRTNSYPTDDQNGDFSVGIQDRCIYTVYDLLRVVNKNGLAQLGVYAGFSRNNSGTLHGISTTDNSVQPFGGSWEAAAGLSSAGVLGAAVCGTVLLRRRRLRRDQKPGKSTGAKKPWRCGVEGKCPTISVENPFMSSPMT